MRIGKIRYVFYLLILFSFSSDSVVRNTAFYSGEEIVYKTYYNWGFIWLKAGEVVFKVKKAEYKGVSCYNISGIGGTYPSYDWIYKVRDRFEAWVDSVSLKPYRYIRDIHEGKKKFYNECYFNYQKRKAYCVTKDQEKPIRLDTVSIGINTLDPLSMIYYSRNIDFNAAKLNDTLPISLFLDNKTYSLYVRYLGRTEFVLEDKRKFNCIKYSPLLVDGTIFNGGEGMTVWVTDDKNRIPLYVEAPILVGSIKVEISGWNGLRNEMTSLIK